MVVARWLGKKGRLREVGREGGLAGRAMPFLVVVAATDLPALSWSTVAVVSDGVLLRVPRLQVSELAGWEGRP